MTTEGAPSALSKATAGLKSQVAVVLYKETGGVTINGFHYNFRRRIEEIDAIDYRCNQRSIVSGSCTFIEPPYIHKG